jgi:gluconate 2-dehydrogenase gamma chain
MSTNATKQPVAGPRNPARRRLLQAAAGAAAVALPSGGASAQQAPHPAAPPAESRAAQSPKVYVFFNPAEAAFIEAALARLIPKDESGPGAIEAGVPEYVDRQLAGAWGAGERLYRAGPWHAGTPSQGYQLPFTPAEMFRAALKGVDASFPKMSARDQDAHLDALQKEKRDLGGVPSNIFFESLLEVTIEGFFSDPAYGGNRDMAAWKMIGFPGAYADFYELVDRHGYAYNAPPTSLAQDARGHVHVVRLEDRMENRMQKQQQPR